MDISNKNLHTEVVGPKFFYRQPIKQLGLAITHVNSYYTCAHSKMSSKQYTDEMTHTELPGPNFLSNPGSSPNLPAIDEGQYPRLPTNACEAVIIYSCFNTMHNSWHILVNSSKDLIVCLFDWCLTSYSRVFHLYDDGQKYRTAQTNLLPVIL